MPILGSSSLSGTLVSTCLEVVVFAFVLFFSEQREELKSGTVFQAEQTSSNQKGLAQVVETKKKELCAVGGCRF